MASIGLTPRTIAWIAIVALLGLALYLFGPILAPFIVAAVFAYICQPIVRRLLAMGVPSTLAAAIVLLGLTAVLVTLLLVILPLFIREVAQLLNQLPGWFARLDTSLAPWINQKLGTSIKLDPATIKGLIGDALQSQGDAGLKMLGSLGMGSLGLLGVLADLVLIPVVLFFLLRDWSRLLDFVENLIPRRVHDDVISFVKEADGALAQYLHGQILVIACMVAYYAITLWLTGLSFFIPIAVISGLIVFIPYVGAATGLTLATLAAAMQWGEVSRMAWVWGVYAIGITVESNFVTPKIVGERIGLHPVAVIFALLAFGQLFGFVGLVVALPASAVLLVALRKIRVRYLASELYREP
jgi:predicted PurR-regulated permease PerM